MLGLPFLVLCYYSASPLSMEGGRVVLPAAISMRLIYIQDVRPPRPAGLYVYFFLKLIGLADGNHWDLLNTPHGHLYLLEIVGFVALPCALYVFGVMTRNVRLVRITGAWTVIGILFNRFNVLMIAMNWQTSPHYRPSWMEVTVSLALVTMGIWVFRLIVNRLPVMSTDKPAGGTNTLKQLWSAQAEKA